MESVPGQPGRMGLEVILSTVDSKKEDELSRPEWRNPGTIRVEVCNRLALSLYLAGMVLPEKVGESIADFIFLSNLAFDISEVLDDAECSMIHSVLQELDVERTGLDRNEAIISLGDTLDDYRMLVLSRLQQLSEEAKKGNAASAFGNGEQTPAPGFAH